MLSAYSAAPGMVARRNLLSFSEIVSLCGGRLVCGGRRGARAGAFSGGNQENDTFLTFCCAITRRYTVSSSIFDFHETELGTYLRAAVHMHASSSEIYKYC